MKNILFTLSIAMLFSSVSVAQTGPTQSPIDKLPTTAKSIKGKLSLFTDWKANDQGALIVYIVNRSGKAEPIEYCYESFDLKLEAKNDQGVWERAAVHIDVTCGTGCGTIKLNPAHFVRGEFMLPANQAKSQVEMCQKEITEIKEFMQRARMTKAAYDERMARIEMLEKQVAKNRIEGDDWGKREVRLRMYDVPSLVVSNTSHQMVNTASIENAKRDVMAVRVASVERLEAILSGKEKFVAFKSDFGLPFDPKATAIQTLKRADIPQATAKRILQQVVTTNEDEKLVGLAKQMLERSPFNGK